MTVEEVLNLCKEYNVEIYLRYDFIPDTLIIRTRKDQFEIERAISARAVHLAGFELTFRIILRDMAAELDRKAKEAKA